MVSSSVISDDSCSSQASGLRSFPGLPEKCLQQQLSVGQMVLPFSRKWAGMRPAIYCLSKPATGIQPPYSLAGRFCLLGHWKYERSKLPDLHLRRTLAQLNLRARPNMKALMKDSHSQLTHTTRLHRYPQSFSEIPRDETARGPSHVGRMFPLTSIATTIPSATSSMSATYPWKLLKRS